VASPPAPAAPATTSDALQHYRQALEALRRGDWKEFGTEMDALQKALQATAAPPPS